MRIVANYGTSLLDYLNNDKDISDVMSEEIDDSCLSTGAKKTLEEHGIHLKSGSTAGSAGSTIGNTGSTNESDRVYSDIRKAADDLRDNSAALSSTKEDSIFATAEKNGKTDKAVDQITKFVSNFNELLKKMDKMGGDKNDAYKKELAVLVKANEADLKKVGVTADKDGVLSIDKDVFGKASVADLKTAFAGKSAFADTVARKSVYVEANAISAMCSSTVSNYSNSGTNSDYSMASFLKSI